MTEPTAKQIAALKARHEEDRRERDARLAAHQPVRVRVMQELIDGLAQLARDHTPKGANTDGR